jgi:plastocyanin
LSFFANSYSGTWTVQATNFSFIPNTLNVSVGDSVKWVWVTGDHTTTSISVPGGAATWDALLTSAQQTYIYVVTVPGTYQYKCTPHFPSMVGSFNASPIGIKPISNKIPSSYNLYQNFPNPFNPVTKVKFDIAVSGNVKLTVYNIIGQETSSLVNEHLNAGTYEIDWNAGNIPSGIYYYTLRAGSYVETKKMILIK